MSDYKMPNEIKNKFTKEMLLDFRNKRNEIFDREDHMSNTSWTWEEGTGGWSMAFEYMCKKYGLNDILDYIGNLKWYDYDSFNSQLSDIMVEYGIVSDAVTLCETATYILCNELKQRDDVKTLKIGNKTIFIVFEQH